MSVQSLFTSAMYKFGQSPDNQRFSDDFLSAINDAQNEIANRRRWGFLKTSSTVTATISTRTVSLPAAFGKPYDHRGALRITSPAANLGDTIELIPMDSWYNDNYEDGSTTGTPSMAYIMGDLLYLSPIPDAAYVIAMIYYKRPTAIADTSTAITIPAAYELLLKKCVYRSLQDNGYSSITELQVSDNDIEKIINSCARDDIAKYGGATFNLNSSTYVSRTI